MLTPDQKLLLDELAKAPVWEALRQVVKERMELQFGYIARQLMVGKKIDDVGVEYQRGFFAGMKFLLDSPKALSEQEILNELERRGRTDD